MSARLSERSSSQSPVFSSQSSVHSAPVSPPLHRARVGSGPHAPLAGATRAGAGGSRVPGGTSPPRRPMPCRSCASGPEGSRWSARSPPASCRTTSTGRTGWPSHRTPHLLRLARPRAAVRIGLEVFRRRRHGGRAGHARHVPRDDAGDARRRVPLRRQLQPARRPRPVVGLGRRGRQAARGRAHPNLPDAARLAHQPPGHPALLGVHDGRHARRDRHGQAEGVRYFTLTPGREAGHDGAPPVTAAPSADHAAHAAGHGAEPLPRGTTICSPTWAQPSADGTRVFVACNASSEIVEIDAASWTVARRIPAGPGVYNLAVTRDGRLLLASNRRGQSVSVFEIRFRQGAGATADEAPRRARDRRDARRSLRVRHGGGRLVRGRDGGGDRSRGAQDRGHARPAAAGRRRGRPAGRRALSTARACYFVPPHALTDSSCRS